jgi:hypothetical protein
MSDLLDRCLARLDQLETLARAAGGVPWHWERAEDDVVSTPDLASEYLADAADVALLGPAGSAGHESDWAKDLPLSAIESASEVRSGAAAHIIAWDPPAVLTLCAGIRKICEEHRPFEWNEDQCNGCGLDRTGAAMNTPDECPTLEAVAGMLGVDPDEPA